MRKEKIVCDLGGMFELFIVLVLVIATISIVSHFKTKKKDEEIWRDMARAFKLTYVNTGLPGLKGRYRERNLNVRVHRDSDRTYYTTLELHYNYLLAANFQITPHRGTPRMVSLVGYQDINLGDPAFDRAVILKSREENEVREFFRSGRIRSACQKFVSKSRYSEIKISNMSVNVSVAGKLTSISETRLILDRLMALVIVFEEENEKYRARINSDAEPIPSSPPPLPVKKKEKPVVPEEWHGNSLASEKTKPVPVLDASGKTEKVTASPSPPKKEKKPKRQKSVALPAAPPAKPSSPVTVDSKYLSIGEIGDLLFEPKVGRYQSAKRFDQLCKGEKVRWRCRLDSIDAGEIDRVFGGGSGLVAVSDLGVLPGMESGFGGLTVKYRIGEERGSQLEELIGSQVDFDGELIKYDPFSKTIYLDSGDPKPKTSLRTASPIVSYAEQIKSDKRFSPGKVRKFS